MTRWEFQRLPKIEQTCLDGARGVKLGWIRVVKLRLTKIVKWSLIVVASLISEKSVVWNVKDWTSLVKSRS